MEAHMVFQILHVACGSVALLTAAMAFMTEKGPRFHAKVGRVYGGAMVGVGLTAVILWLLGATVFLLFIAFFSTYLVLSGWRMGRNRQGSVDGQDRALILFGSTGGLGLLAMSVSILITEEGPFGDGRGFAAVPLVFGLLSGGLAILQQRLTNGGTGPRGKLRIQMHTLYMGSGTIATVTAFVVTALDGGVFAWLMPTVVGTALLTWNLRGVRLGSIASAQTTV